MTNPEVTFESNHRIDVDALMERVRQEARDRGYMNPSSENRPNLYLERVDGSARSVSRTKRIELRSAYALTDLLEHGDADFLRNAYIAVLRRSPDAGGYDHYIEALRRGEIDRVELIGRLRYSAEGRAGGVPIRGLRRAFIYRQLRKLPVLGYLISWCNHLLRLPRLATAVGRIERETRTLRDSLEHRLQQTERQLALLSARVDQTMEVSRQASSLSAIAAELSEVTLAEPHPDRTPANDGR